MLKFVYFNIFNLCATFYCCVAKSHLFFVCALPFFGAECRNCFHIPRFLSFTKYIVSPGGGCFRVKPRIFLPKILPLRTQFFHFVIFQYHKKTLRSFYGTKTQKSIQVFYEVQGLCFF